MEEKVWRRCGKDKRNDQSARKVRGKERVNVENEVNVEKTKIMRCKKGERKRKKVV